MKMDTNQSIKVTDMDLTTQIKNGRKKKIEYLLVGDSILMVPMCKQTK